MTRINANINPCKLIDQHLLAEYREIVRIPTLVNKKIYHDNIPDQFKLGTGHVKYFYNKIAFLHKRFLELKKELNKRKIQSNIDDTCFKNVNILYYNDINDNLLIEANNMIIERISERIENMKKIPTYYKNKISKKEAIDLLNKK